jgi:uncharacterized membrane protein
MASIAPRRTPAILHPLLNPIPVAFFIAALALDYLYWQFGTGERIAFWLIGIGLALSGFAIGVACFDVLRNKHVLQLPDIGLYMSGILTAYAIEFVNWCARYFQGTQAVVPMGFELSAFAVLIFVLMASTGWRIAYR